MVSAGHETNVLFTAGVKDESRVVRQAVGRHAVKGSWILCKVWRHARREVRQQLDHRENIWLTTEGYGISVRG